MRIACRPSLGTRCVPRQKVHAPGQTAKLGAIAFGRKDLTPRHNLRLPNMHGTFHTVEENRHTLKTLRGNHACRRKKHFTRDATSPDISYRGSPYVRGRAAPSAPRSDLFRLFRGYEMAALPRFFPAASFASRDALPISLDLLHNLR